MSSTDSTHSNVCYNQLSTDDRTSATTLITVRYARMYRFCLVCVCLSGCQKLIISSLHHILHSPGGDWGWPLSGMSVCPPGPRYLSGAFGLFNGLRSTPIHFNFKHCLGMLRKKYTHSACLPTPPPSTHTPPAAVGCVIQPRADSSFIYYH